MTTRPNVSDSAAPQLAAEDCLQLQQRRGSDDLYRWELGDLLVALVNKYGKLPRPNRLGQTQVFELAANQLGKKRATLRRYHDTARAFPDQALRGAYEGFTWYNFAELRHAKYDKERESLMDHFYVSADDFGGLQIPPDVQAAQLAGGGKKEATWAELQARAVSALERLREGTKGPTWDKLSEILVSVEGLQEAAV